MTFAVEKHGGKLWLCTVDANGYKVRLLAEFSSPECVIIFNETLALAKMAAHAHGQSGI